MVKKEVIGNIILRKEELDELRKAIVERYKTLSEKPVHFPERVFNSNLDNYDDLKTNIKDNVKFDLKSNKPLAVLFHFSKSSQEGAVTFRKKFINSLYEYAHGIGREEFLATRKAVFASSKEISQLGNIEGYWECYYDKHGRFAENLRNKKEASISKLAYWISGDSIRNAAAQFFQSKNTGKGSIEVKGTNLILRLENDINTEPQFVFMNCGRDVENSTVHFERMVGCYLHIDDAASPKVGKCLMFWSPKKTWDLENTIERENFSRNDTITFQLDKNEDDKLLQEIKEFFFEEDINTLTANVNVFKDIIKDPKLDEFIKGI
jgi:hypothetical protein